MVRFGSVRFLVRFDSWRAKRIYELWVVSWTNVSADSGQKFNSSSCINLTIWVTHDCITAAWRRDFHMIILLFTSAIYYWLNACDSILSWWYCELNPQKREKKSPLHIILNCREWICIACGINKTRTGTIENTWAEHTCPE